jgi:beta-alanine degradation protein BauB
MGVAQHLVSADNDEVRVTTWTFAAPGAATGQHRHEFDYVVVPITGGRFEVVDVDGSVRMMNQVAGSPYLGSAGTAHDVVSAADHKAVFVEIELKRTSAGRPDAATA